MRHKFFTKQEEVLIIEALQMAEQFSTGEIKVHVEKTCRRNILERAAFLFSALDLHKTHDRNGVLIYIAYKDRTFAVIGDTGITSVTGPDFWNDIRDRMQERFRNGDFAKGVCEAIDRLGEELKKHFSATAKRINETSDHISYS